jgi:hypothetical protein
MMTVDARLDTRLMAECPTCHGARTLRPYYGSEKVLPPPCPTCNGTGSVHSGSGSILGGCLKYVAGGILLLYVIFYFALNPQARHHPLSIFTVTVDKFHAFLAYWYHRWFT